ncbi:MAG: MFS transporter [Anaerolineales bacterium]|jgi:MFS family permease
MSVANPPLITIGISESVSSIGNWITMMAVYAMLIFGGDGGVVESSGIFIAGLLPIFIFSPIAGWLCDHYDRKWLMVISELLSGLVISGLIFTDRIELIYAILALQAVSISIMIPARRASVPDIVDKDSLPKANAFLEQLAGIVKIIAPMLAGLILTVLNPHTAIILDIVSFLLSALILTRLPALNPTSKKQISSVEEQDLGVESQAWGVLKTSIPLRLLFVSIFLAIFIIIGFDVLSPIYVRDVLAGDQKFFGFAVGGIGLGTVVASLLLMLRKRKRNPWLDLLSGLFMLGNIVFVLAIATLIPNLTLIRILILLSCFVGGIGNGLMLIQVNTLLQLLSPPSMLGRLGGVFQSTAVAAQLLGLLVAPLLVPNILSMGQYFGLASLAVIALIIFTAANLRKPSFRLKAAQAGAK